MNSFCTVRWLGFEAMTAGCAVATRVLGDSPPSFQPPVQNIDRRSIHQQLRQLLGDRELRKRLALQGRKYVECNNQVSNVVKSILSTAMGERDTTDYVPDFFHRYIPQTDEEQQAISVTTRLVSNEPWFSDVGNARPVSAEKREQGVLA